MFEPHVQMISPGFQRSLSAGEVAGLCYGLVMDARYCRLCLGAGCFLGPGFVFTLGVSLLVSIFSSAPRGFLSITWGSCWWSRCVFLLRSYERALRSSFGPLGFGLKWGFTFVPHVFVLISSCARLLCLFFLHTIWYQEERLVVHQDDESAGSWFIRAVIVFLEFGVIQRYSLLV